MHKEKFENKFCCECYGCSNPKRNDKKLSCHKDRSYDVSTFLVKIGILGEKWPDIVIKWTFISRCFLQVSQACAWLQATSETITFEPIKI